MDFHQPVKRPTDRSVLYHLFPTPVYAAMVDNLDVVQSEIDGVCDKLEFIYNPNFGQTHKLSAPSFKTNVIGEHNMVNFSEQIHKHIDHYLTAIEFEQSGYFSPENPLKYDIVSSWITKFEKRDYAHIHNHGHCDISGVYYYKVGEDKDETGDLFFQSPVPSMITSFTFNHYAYKQCQIPQVGKLLLFPAYLDHGVATNETGYDRMSLSFNILFENR